MTPAGGGEPQAASTECWSRGTVTVRYERIQAQQVERRTVDACHAPQRQGGLGRTIPVVAWHMALTR